MCIVIKDRGEFWFFFKENGFSQNQTKLTPNVPDYK